MDSPAPGTLMPLNFQKWIEENRENLKPAVGPEAGSLPAS